MTDHLPITLPATPPPPPRTTKDPAVRQFLLTNLVTRKELHPSAGDDKRLGVDGDSADDLVFRIHLENLRASLPPIHGFLEGLENNARPTFHRPTLFVYGTRSDYVNEQMRPQIQGLFPLAELRGLPTGHWVHSGRSHRSHSFIIIILLIMVVSTQHGIYPPIRPCRGPCGIRTSRVRVPAQKITTSLLILQNILRSLATPPSWEVASSPPSGAPPPLRAPKWHPSCASLVLADHAVVVEVPLPSLPPFQTHPLAKMVAGTFPPLVSTIQGWSTCPRAYEGHDAVTWTASRIDSERVGATR